MNMFLGKFNLFIFLFSTFLAIVFSSCGRYGKLIIPNNQKMQNDQNKIEYNLKNEATSNEIINDDMFSF